MTNEKHPAPAVSMPDNAVDSRRINILLVDDQQENLTALAAILEDDSYHLVTAMSGADALRWLLREEFAIILLDVLMPDMDGFEVASLIKQRPATRHTPIIFLTAALDAQYINRGYAVGAVDYLQKPLEPSVVRTKVSVFIDLFRKTREIQQQAEAIRHHERTQLLLQQAEMRRANEQAQVRLEQQARMVAEAARRRSEFLADSGTMMARTLNYTETLTDLTRLVVPAMADWCHIAVRDADGAPDFAVVYIDPEQEPRLQGMVAEFLALAIMPDHPVAQVMRTAQGDLFATVEASHSLLQVPTNDEETLLGRLALRSVIVVPLLVRSEVIGTMTFGSVKSAAPFLQPDLAFFEELGRRVALAVDNALLYNEAKAAIRVRDEFLSIASHELRTPLTVLQLQMAAIRRRLEKLDDGLDVVLVLTDKVTIVDRQILRLAKLIENLLDVSRIAEGRMTVDWESVDLVEVVRDVVERFGEEQAQLHNPIVIEASDPAVGWWDRTLVDQVVTNLVSNAIKYGADQAITVAITSHESMAVLTVRDRGIGIAPEDRERIFQRYERAVPVRSYGGLGLGLYITAKIVAALGGTLDVISDTEPGSIFRVFLPVIGAPVMPDGRNDQTRSGLGPAIAREIIDAHDERI
ncbi:MAG: hybrid sensor histidine kinase/response regulator [Candidatus Sericytochromatia bacterium]|nr:hybrid sensor histidine kinase/response regulator [Candidatus Sericytochromatia bacterium]